MGWAGFHLLSELNILPYFGVVSFHYCKSHALVFYRFLTYSSVSPSSTRGKSLQALQVGALGAVKPPAGVQRSLLAFRQTHSSMAGAPAVCSDVCLGHQPCLVQRVKSQRFLWPYLSSWIAGVSHGSQKWCLVKLVTQRGCFRPLIPSWYGCQRTRPWSKHKQHFHILWGGRRNQTGSTRCVEIPPLQLLLLTGPRNLSPYCIPLQWHRSCPWWGPSGLPDSLLEDAAHTCSCMCCT